MTEIDYIPCPKCSRALLLEGTETPLDSRVRQKVNQHLALTHDESEPYNALETVSRMKAETKKVNEDIIPDTTPGGWFDLKDLS